MLKSTTTFDVFETLSLRSTSARQTDLNTTEINYRLLKTRARRIYECLRNACEQALHLGESREVTREPHAKGDAGARGAEERTSAPHATSPLARAFARQNMLLFTC